MPIIELTGFDEYVMLRGVANQNTRLARFKTDSLTPSGRKVSVVFAARHASRERGYPDFSFQVDLPSSLSAVRTVAFLGEWLASQESLAAGFFSAAPGL
jgi:hypothetical protein